MKRILSIVTIASLTALLLSACMMPTHPSQIAPSYTPDMMSDYKDLDCPSLQKELRKLVKKENQLVSVQEERISTSQVQAFWVGFGQGDGYEASELASVRGERQAVQNVMDAKGCR